MTLYKVSQHVCEMALEKLTLPECLDLADKNPCFSMMALVTLLMLEKFYPLPLDFDKQQEIFVRVSFCIPD